MSDRVALLRKGRIAQAGRAFDLYRAPKDILAPALPSELLRSRLAQMARPGHG